MVLTSEEVDRYVSKVQRTTGGTKEKEMKSFSFAKLYREARDNDSARRHLAIYISSNETDFRGHRMMGQLLEDTGNHTKALESYRRSLELNNTQNDLVLKVVELYCKVPTNPQRARVWADRAARLFPGNPAVFKLRMHLLECSGQVDYEELEDLLSEEMVKRPREVDLHIRLVRMYAATGRLDEAFAHCVSVNGTTAFQDSLEWWTCTVEIFQEYMSAQERLVQEDQELSPVNSVVEAHSNLLWALCTATKLHLHHSSTRDCANALYRFDHSFLIAHKRKVVQSSRSPGSKETEWAIGLQEMRAQLYMHCGTLLMKLAKESYLSWPRALRMVCACYASSAAVQEPTDEHSTGTIPRKKAHMHKWHMLACCRLSHVGHILTAVKNRHGDEWLENCTLDGCTPQGLRQIISSIYDGKDLSMSFLASDDEFQISEMNLPALEQLISYDEAALVQNPDDLQMLLWIGLHWYQLDKSMKPGAGVVVSRIFDGLAMDTRNIQNPAADSLCHRDLEAFIYAVVRSAAATVLEDQEVYYEDFQPRLLAQPLCSPLGSRAQSDWWSAAHSLYTGAARTTQSGKVRSTVQKGLEKIRALANHGLHVRLLIYLAQNFGEKGEYLKSAGSNQWHYKEHWKSLEDRSIHYWKEALTVLDKVEKDQSIPFCKDPLFPPLPDIRKEELQYNLQCARLTLGELAVREGRLEEAMALFEQVKTPRGIWNLSQVYKYLASLEAQAATEETGSDSNESAREYYTCLGNARNLLLAGLQMINPDDRRRETFQEGLNEIEDMLNTDPTRANNPKKTLDFRQLEYQASRSSTTISEVQDSDDNFWVEQPQDASTKDLIAKLSEVTLNNGYLQEQMALRDQQMSQLAEHVRMLQSEVENLKHSRLDSGSALTTPKFSPVGPSLGGAVPSLMSTPLARTPSGDQTRLGPNFPPVSTETQLEPEAGANFFAGLSQSNSPEKRAEPDEEPDDYTPGRRSRNVSASSATSQDDGIHFEPLIPLPEKIEVETGEEREEVMYEGRTKLYRFDKETSAWKERGVGNLKILYNSAVHRFRIIMRRENVHKVCANHFITSEMEIRAKQGSGNSLMWTSFADFADEVAKVEQLAVRFKTPEDASAFREAFGKAQEGLRNPDAWKAKFDDVEEDEEYGYDEDDYEDEEVDDDEDEDEEEEVAARFASKPGAWACSPCQQLNAPDTLKCGACGNAKFALPVSQTDVSKMSFPFQSQQQFSKPSSLATAPPASASLSSCVVAQPQYTFGTPCTVSPDAVTPTTTPTFTEAPADSGQPAAPAFTLAPFGVPASKPATSASKFVFGPGAVGEGATATQPNKPFSFAAASPAPPQVPSVFGAGSKDQPISFKSFSPEAPAGLGGEPDSSSDHSAAGTFSFGASKAIAAETAKLYWQTPGPSPFSQANRPGSDVRFPASQVLASMAKARGSEAKVDSTSLHDDSAPALLSQPQPEGLGTAEDAPYDFTPFVSPDSDQEDGLKAAPAEAKSGVVLEEYDSDQADVVHGIFDESGSDTESEDSSVCSNEEEVESLPSSTQNAWTPVKGDTQGPTVSAKLAPAFSPQATAGRRILTARSPMRTAKKRDEDCIIIYEVRPSRVERERAVSLALPPNFYNYTRAEACTGCRGCREETSDETKPEVAAERAPVPAETPEQQTPSLAAGPIFGRSSNLAGLTFSSVAASGEGAFGGAPEGRAFPQAGAKLFQGGTDGDDTGGDIHFEPIIPLPDEIKVVTGEEGKEVLFSERAKLYRYDKDNATWKERGVGEIKLLWDPDLGLGRVIMRRELIKKLCANHVVEPDAHLAPNVSSDRSWVWNALDFSDGDPRPEQLAVRFKSPALASRFKETFEALQQRRSEQPETAKTSDVGRADHDDSQDGKGKDGRAEDGALGSSGTQQLREQFAPPQGAWDCDACYVQNAASVGECSACGAPRGGEEKRECTAGPQPAQAAEQKSDAFLFGSTATPKLGVSPAFTFGQPTSSSSFSFSMPSFTIGRADPVTEDDDQEQEDSPARVSSPAKATATPPKPTPASPLPKGLQTDLPFGTSSPSKFTFKMNFSPTSPSRQPRSPSSPSSPAGPNPASPGVETEDDRIYFEPLIPLPDKVEAYTGEEGEQPVFCKRAKLYRFDKDSGQWKERGVGEMKILHHNDNNTFRLLMRRENVLKLCCNHRLMPEMRLKKMGKSERAFAWVTTADFAEEEARQEFLSIRFASVDMAKEFERAFTAAQSVVAVGVAEERTPGERREDSAVGGAAGGGSAQDEKGKTQAQHLDKSPKPSEATQATPPAAPPGFLFGSPDVSSLTFADLAKKSPSFSLGDKAAQKSPGGFPGEGRPLFGSPPSQTEADQTCVSPDDDGPHFEPIIALPEKIKPLTGEEEEQALFSHRAKLFRFDKDTKQWKERGIGDIKLLRNKNTSKVRVLMRREQVLKVCANHCVTADTVLKPNAGSDKSWVWHTAADFAEEEPRPEQLAVRFKSADVALEFKKAFDECREIVRLADSARDGGPSEDSGGAQQLDSTEVLEKFKPKAGSWECDACLVPNEEGVRVCVACGTPKPGAAGDKPPPSAEGTSVFDKFKPKPGSWECDTCLVNNDSTSTACSACGTPGPNPDQGQSASSKPATQAAQITSSGFTFGSQSQKSDGDGRGFSFGTSSSGSGFPFGSEPSKTSGGFVFGSAPAAAGPVSPGQDSSFVFSIKQRGPDSKEAGTDSEQAGTDPKPADSSSGFLFGETATRTVSGADSSDCRTEPDSTSGESAGSTGFLFASGQGETESKPDSSSGFLFGSMGNKIDSDSTGKTGFLFGAKQSETGSKPGSSTSGFLFGSAPSKPDSTTVGSTGNAGFLFGGVPVKMESKPPAQSKGSPWECETCYVDNSAERASCIACDSPKPELGTDASDSAVNAGCVSGESKPAPEPAGFTFGGVQSKTAPTATAPTSSTDAFTFGGVRDPGPSDVSPLFAFGSNNTSAGSRPLESRGPSSEENAKSLEATGPAEAQTQPEERGDAASEARVVSIDLELTDWPEPTPAEVERAERLLLPKTFYLYNREVATSQAKTTPDKAAGRHDKKDGSVETPDTTSALKGAAPGASVFGGRSAGSLSSFASLATSPSDGTGAFSQGPRGGFKGQGAQLFSPRKSTGAEEGEYDPEVEQDGADFQAIVSLPEIDQRTGEEDEVVKFTHRAKLYRFDATAGQWKERGVGDIKILRHKESGRARLVMRRDQIHKLCANHYIMPNMELRPNVGSDRSWVWHAQDFSEETVKDEQLAVKFKSVPLAEEFREVFHACRDTAQEGGERSGKDGEKEEPEIDQKNWRRDGERLREVQLAGSREERNGGSQKKAPIGDQDEVRDKERYVDGNEAKSQLNDVKSGKDATSQNSETEPEAVGAKPNVECDGSDKGAAKLQSDGAKSEKDAAAAGTVGAKSYVDGAESEKDAEKSKAVGAKSYSEAVFERPKVDERKSEKDEACDKPSSGFLFGSASVSGLLFKDLSTSSLFGSLPKDLSGSPPKKSSSSPGRPAANRPNRRESEGSGESGAEDEANDADHVHFEPLIPLPEEVRVVTGEEHEEVVFQERCKLYRFHSETSTWKERGVGLLKLLREAHARRARVVMRREQIHKLCANHFITSEMQLRPNGQSGKAWTWQTLADVSDGGEGKVEQLAVRFKTEDAAGQFKEKFEECRDALISGGQDASDGVDRKQLGGGNDDTTQPEEEPERTGSATDAAGVVASPPNTGPSTGSPTARPTCSPEISKLLEEVQKQD